MAAIQPLENRSTAPQASFADDEARWQAVVVRDRAADGQFFTAVRTTGVYCRPSCAGRPLRKNVTFYATAEAAEEAGYRACKRCRPNKEQRS